MYDLATDFDVHNPANLAPICRPCNLAKSDRQPGSMLVGVILSKAADKKANVIRRVLRFSADTKRSADAAIADSQITNPVEIAARIRELSDRQATTSSNWRHDFQTMPGGITVRFTPADAQESPPNEPLPPIFDFPESDPQAVHAEQRLADLANFGGEIAVAGHYLAQPADGIGPSWAGVIGLDGPDDQVLVTVGQTQLSPGTNYQLAVVSASGTVKQRLQLHPAVVFRGHHGGRILLHDGAGIFTAHLQTARNESGEVIHVNVNANDFAGHYPYAVRSSVDLFLQAEATDRLELRLNNQCIGDLLDGDPAERAGALQHLRKDAEIIAALERVQAHAGEPFTIPEELPADECADLLAAARLLDGKAARVPSSTVTLTIYADCIEDFLQAVLASVPGDLTMLNADYNITCASHQINIGRAAIRATQVTLTNTDELRAAIGSGVDVVARFKCVEGTNIYATLMQPDDDIHTTPDSLFSAPHHISSPPPNPEASAA
ncbi:hypothetical protein ACTOB_002239 [Actinoplanes oblitus]|uniref:HNH domain-containing protein n=1 Tax=Actinoplanes oblitus TaxID=3040509 RepID=A0ABY8WLB7_9ACTN|nr:hypothetical protein [Actinoplanes oblitus]WIM98635.1 hypothetical protein ACTOB_002239 [Actinoplanes oblitus]